LVSSDSGSGLRPRRLISPELLSLPLRRGSPRLLTSRRRRWRWLSCQEKRGNSQCGPASESAPREPARRSTSGRYQLNRKKRRPLLLENETDESRGFQMVDSGGIHIAEKP